MREVVTPPEIEGEHRGLCRTHRVRLVPGVVNHAAGRPLAPFAVAVPPLGRAGKGYIDFLGFMSVRGINELRAEEQLEADVRRREVHDDRACIHVVTVLMS